MLILHALKSYDRGGPGNGEGPFGFKHYLHIELRHKIHLVAIKPSQSRWRAHSAEFDCQSSIPHSLRRCNTNFYILLRYKKTSEGSNAARQHGRERERPAAATAAAWHGPHARHPRGRRRQRQAGVAPFCCGVSWLCGQRGAGAGHVRRSGQHRAAAAGESWAGRGRTGCAGTPLRADATLALATPALPSPTSSTRIR